MRAEKQPLDFAMWGLLVVLVEGGRENPLGASSGEYRKKIGNGEFRLTTRRVSLSKVKKWSKR